MPYPPTRGSVGPTGGPLRQSVMLSGNIVRGAFAAALAACKTLGKPVCLSPALTRLCARPSALRTKHAETGTLGGGSDRRTQRRSQLSPWGRPKLLCLSTSHDARGHGRTPRDQMAPSTRRGGLVDGVEGRGLRDAESVRGHGAHADRGNGVERRPREAESANGAASMACRTHTTQK